LLLKWILIILMLGFQSSWASDSFSYSGRLVNGDGSPVTGPVELKVELAYSNDPTVILCAQDLSGIGLTNGVFHVKLDLDCSPKTITQILAETPATHSVAIRITDLTHSKMYSFQALHSMPYSNVSKQLVSMGASDGQVLTWDSGAWKPLAPAAVESGSIGTSEIADGSVTDPKVASGISRSKLAAGAGGYVLVNDGSSGLISEVPYLSIAQGGTGATTVSGIFSNLGLGTAATADLGLVTGNALAFDDLKFCLPTEKLMMTAAPTVQWKCEPENSPEDSTKLPLAGGTMTGDIDMGTNRILGLEAPVDADEAVNKAYVDTLSESNWKASGNNIYSNNIGNVGVGVTAPVEKIDVAGNVALTGGIRLRSGINYVELKAPTLSGHLLLVLPAADGTAGQVLKTDGAGNLGWVDATAGSITSVAATLPLSATTSSGATTLSLNYDGSTIGMNGSNQLTIPNGGITNTQINASAAIAWTKIDKTGSAAADIGAASELVSIVAGTGLNGGGTLEADRTLNVDVGTSANQIVQMDATAKLPAIDGSQLTNLPFKWLDVTGGINYPSGNVGVGTTTPSAKLDVNGLLKTQGLYHNALQFSLSSSTTSGIKIKTNIPFLSDEMTTVIIEGYDYRGGVPIGIMLTWYGYSAGSVFLNYSASSFGGQTPTIKLANEGGKVVIHLARDKSDQYYNRMNVRVFDNVRPTSFYQGWTWADEAITGTDVVTVPYINRVGNLYADGNIGIGTTTPSFSLDLGSKKDAVRLPVGTTTERPATPANGVIRYNSDNSKLEAYVAGMWQDLAAAATGGSYLSSGGGTLSGALTISSGGADITGGINANSGAIINTGNITGSSALTVAAGGTNQNLSLNSSGTGSVNIGSASGTAVTVLSDGNVGIGTINPITQLHVKDGSGIKIQSTNAQLDFSDATNSILMRMDGSANLEFKNSASTNLMHINYLGNIGIGNTNPSTRLHVSGGNGEIIRWQYGTDNTYGYLSAGTSGVSYNIINPESGFGHSFNVAGLEVMRINDVGNVGIGTTTPLSKLHVEGGDIRARHLVLDRLGTTGPSLIVTDVDSPLHLSASNGDQGHLVIKPSGNVGIGLMSPNEKLDVEGNIRVTGFVEDFGPDPSYIWHETDQALDQKRWRLQSIGGKLQFHTAADTGATLSTPVTLLRSGNVGVGTTDPDRKLHITHTNKNSSIRLDGFVAGGNFSTLMSGSDFGSLIEGADNGQVVMVLRDNDGNDGFRIISGGGNFMADSVYDTAVFSALSSGRVGIGMSTPEARLDLNGSQIIRTDTNGYALFAPKNGTTPFGTDYDRFEVRVDPLNPVTYLGNANGGTGLPRSLAFLAGNNERMRLDAATGNVGVGIADTEAALHVRRNIASQNGISFDPLAWNLNSQFKLQSGNNALALSVIGTINERLGIIQTGHSGDGNGNYANLTDPKLSLQPYGGNVGIGMINPYNRLHVTGNIGATGWVGAGCEGACSSDAYAINYADGRIVTYDGSTAVCSKSGGSSTFSCSSDGRLKNTVNPFNHGLDYVLRLQPKTYYWNSDEKNELNYGFIAQEVQKVIPHAVSEHERPEGVFLSLDQGAFIPYMINAIKDLNAKIEVNKEMFDMMNKGILVEHGRRIASLEEENRLLKEENKMIKSFLCKKFDDAEFCDSRP
jgi:hypothetical protein